MIIHRFVRVNLVEICMKLPFIKRAFIRSFFEGLASLFVQLGNTFIFKWI